MIFNKFFYNELRESHLKKDNPKILNVNFKLNIFNSTHLCKALKNNKLLVFKHNIKWLKPKTNVLTIRHENLKYFELQNLYLKKFNTSISNESLKGGKHNLLLIDNIPNYFIAYILYLTPIPKHIFLNYMKFL